MKKHLYLMRHGQTLFNVRRKIQGWCDSPLTEDGKQQALKAKSILDSIEFDHYYSSTAERSSDTLEIIIGNKPYQRLKGIRERGFGTFESESEDLNPSLDKYDEFFPQFGGETTQQVSTRMIQTLTHIMNKEDHQSVLAVSHAGACHCFYSTIEKIKPIGKIPNCAIFHYEFENNQFHFVEMLDPNV